MPTPAALKNQIRHLSKFNKALHNPKAHPRPKKLEPKKTMESAVLETDAASTAGKLVQQPESEDAPGAQQGGGGWLRERC